MDYSYTHDDVTMLIFDLYKTMIDETGYRTIMHEHKTFDELNEQYAFYTRLFAMLDKLGYISPSVRKCVIDVLNDTFDRATLEKACESEELNTENEAEFFGEFKKGVFYNGNNG